MKIEVKGDVLTIDCSDCVLIQSIVETLAKESMIRSQTIVKIKGLQADAVKTVFFKLCGKLEYMFLAVAEHTSKENGYKVTMSRSGNYPLGKIIR